MKTLICISAVILGVIKCADSVISNDVCGNDCYSDDDCLGGQPLCYHCRKPGWGKNVKGFCDAGSRINEDVCGIEC